MTRRSAIGTLLILGASLNQAQTATPSPKTIWGIAELFEWIYQRGQTSGYDTADCLQAHVEAGIKHIIWDLGRSTLCYHSALPTSTLFGGDSRPQSQMVAEVFRKECSLRAAVAFAKQSDVTLYGRLTMNRHYGSNYGGGLRSQYISDHPEWLEQDRRGKTDLTRVCFAIPEYRTERIGILLEAAQLGAQGLCLDFCRQPPLARYHPRLVDPWLETGQADPRKMTAGSPEFLAWARHRCTFITAFLRELRPALTKLEQQSGRKIPVMARINEATLDLNLMEGIDLESWLKEGLIDEVALNPFRLWDFDYPDTAQRYVALCRKHEVKIYGGTNTTAARGTKPNRRSFLERIDRSYREGVDGVALYQTDTPLHNVTLKPLLTPLFPQLSNPGAVTELLTEARKALPELTESLRYFGIDNHSALAQFGHPPMALDQL